LQGLSPSDARQHEAAANAFAAELLLAAAELKAVAWDLIGDDELAADLMRSRADRPHLHPGTLALHRLRLPWA
jgi:hypothetical protein